MIMQQVSIAIYLPEEKLYSDSWEFAFGVFSLPRLC